MKYHYIRSPAFPHLRGGLPLIEIALYHGEHKKTVSALVDSGAAMSVLPYDTGLELGLAWEKQTVPVDVGGVLKNTPAYGVLVRGEISPLPPVTFVDVCVGTSYKNSYIRCRFNMSGLRMLAKVIVIKKASFLKFKITRNFS